MHHGNALFEIAMGMLTKEMLEALVGAGCTECGGNTLCFRAYVDGGIPMMGGEPVGRLFWAYDGEKFVDGVFEVACGKCRRQLFAAEVCPRCHAAGGLAKALTSPNTFAVPGACPACDNEEVRYFAMVPARTTYEGKRAQKAVTAVEPHDDGFHGYRVDCKSCGIVAERLDRCPMCEAPAPLRARPD